MNTKPYPVLFAANTISAVSFCFFISILCSCKSPRSIGYTIKPYVTATFANKNVYKAKDTLTLYKVYNINNGIAYSNVDTTYKLIIHIDQAKKINPQTNGYAYVRYRLVKDGSVSYLKFLPSTYFKKSEKNSVPDVKGKVILYLSPDIDVTDDLKNISVSGTENADRFYFKLTDTVHLNPAQKFLATEQITGIPVSIPFKYRFTNVPGRDRISTAFLLGYAFGFRYRIGSNPYSDNFIRTVFAIGAGTATYFNSASTNPNSVISSQTTTTITYPKQTLPDGGEKVVQIQDVVKTSSDINTTQFMYSTAWGVTLELGSRLNLGIFYGWDHMTGSHKDWVYQSKPWLGTGIGINFGAAAKAAVSK